MQQMNRVAERQQITGVKRVGFNRNTNISLVVWAIASAPFCVLFTGENSFTFQTAIPSIALMALAFIFSNGARQYSRHAFVIAIGFIGVIGISEILAVCTNSYMLTNKTLIRALMFIVIVWFYATAVSHNYTSYEIKILMHLIGLSVCASAFLEFKEYLAQGMYFGRVYPVSLRGQMIDANFFALLVVIQVACCFVVALYSNVILKKVIYFALSGIGIISIILTGSRSGLLCVALIMVLGGMVYVVRPVKGKMSSVIFLAGFSVALLIAASKYISDWMFNRFFVNSYNDGSNEFRVTLWIKAVERWPQHPLFGFGVGNYNYYSAQDWGLAETSTTTHGTVTDFLVDFGIIGLGLFLYIVIDIISGLIVSKQYVLLAMLPGIMICSVIVGAERTVALWLYLIVFYVVGHFCKNNSGISLYDVFREKPAT